MPPLNSDAAQIKELPLLDPSTKAAKKYELAKKPDLDAVLTEYPQLLDQKRRVVLRRCAQNPCLVVVSRIIKRQQEATTRKDVHPCHPRASSLRMAAVQMERLKLRVPTFQDVPSTRLVLKQ